MNDPKSRSTGWLFDKAALDGAVDYVLNRQ